MLKLQTVYKLRVIYRSGATQDFETTKFTISNSQAEWESVGAVKPLKLGLDDVAAVWQLGQRQRIARS